MKTILALGVALLTLSAITPDAQAGPRVSWNISVGGGYGGYCGPRYYAPPVHCAPVFRPAYRPVYRYCPPAPCYRPVYVRPRCGGYGYGYRY
jgi:hypothetical protein